MKKVLLVLGLVTMFSCNKENVSQSNNQTVEDCDCDRIVSNKVFNMIGDAQSGTSSYFWCHITTINDCNKMQKDRSFNYSKDYYTKDELPKVGNCHNIGI